MTFDFSKLAQLGNPAARKLAADLAAEIPPEHRILYANIMGAEQISADLTLQDSTRFELFTRLFIMAEAETTFQFIIKLNDILLDMGKQPFTQHFEAQRTILAIRALIGALAHRDRKERDKLLELERERALEATLQMFLNQDLIADYTASEAKLWQEG